MSEKDEREIEDILSDLNKVKNKKKKINSGDKGDRAERNLCKLLNTRFGLNFERAVGSGNRWSQVKEMSQAMKDTLVGDLVCPPGFLWTIECKSGYQDKVDLHGSFLNGNSTIDSFLEQVSNDAKLSGKKPLLVYKRNMKPWLAFIPILELPMGIEFDYMLYYRDWTCVALEKLLELPDEYFLDKK